MRVINARNPHEALRKGLTLLNDEGVLRGSRNGLVRVMKEPVTTVYSRPWERMVFWKERDANPFLHLYESMWMLSGRNDIEFLARYAKNMRNYSDNGVTLHGAYGHRWISHFGFNQLDVIIERLRSNKEDRRCVLQMWDASTDLGKDFRDVPCNTIATVQVTDDNQLDLTVFCRSNDIIWGAYGANAVHFSVLQEYLAASVDALTGTYTQISVNWHAYQEPLATALPIITSEQPNPYTDIPMTTYPLICGSHDKSTFLSDMLKLMIDIDTGFIYTTPRFYIPTGRFTFLDTLYWMFKAYNACRTGNDMCRYQRGMEILSNANQSVDMVIAAKTWLTKRWEHAVATGTAV